MTLRDEVAEALSDHLRRHGLQDPWTDDVDATTRTMFSLRTPSGDSYTAPRARLQMRLLERLHPRDAVQEGAGSAVVILTAGPPGAGKSSVVRADPRWAGFRQVDADAFKDGLLEVAERGGLLDDLLDDLLDHLLPDGRPVPLRELAAFVHAESTVLLERLRDRCIDRREDFVLHGTLNDLGFVPEMLERMAASDYSHLEVVHVPVDRDTARERVLQRWWADREGAGDGRGGRFVAPDALAAYFTVAGTPRSVEKVRELIELARDSGFEVRLHDRPA